MTGTGHGEGEVVECMYIDVYLRFPTTTDSRLYHFSRARLYGTRGGADTLIQRNPLKLDSLSKPDGRENSLPFARQTGILRAFVRVPGRRRGRRAVYYLEKFVLNNVSPR